jgi:hypothetical protein
MSGRETQDEERQAYAEFARLYGEERYRERLQKFYGVWRAFNEDFFEAALREPHLTLGRTAPRSLGHCSPITDYGGEVQVTLNARLVFGDNTEWVVRAWPAEGSKRFIDDLLLRLTVRQFVVEMKRTEEEGYRGYGPMFVTQANRIGDVLGLESVVPRNRRFNDSKPVACGWPHCVRPSGYYGQDITEAALALVCGSGKGAPSAPPPSQGLLELMQYLLVAGRQVDARKTIERHLEWTREAEETHWPMSRQVEAGAQDENGKPMGEVMCRAEWLEWNGGTVRRMAESIEKCGSFVDLPLLANALVEAGCREESILRHLRAKREHNRRCWVLRLLLAGME